MHFGSFMPLRSIWDEGLQTLAKDFPEHCFSLGLKPDSPEVPDLDLMLAGTLPKDIYLASSKLKGIFQSFTGINHLPLAQLRERGVQVLMFTPMPSTWQKKPLPFAWPIMDGSWNTTTI